MDQVFVSRDLQRCRKVDSAIGRIAVAFFDLLSSDSPNSKLCRKAFVPAFLGKDSNSNSEVDLADADIRKLFASPPQLILVQGTVTAETVATAWSTPSPKPLSAIYLSYALHSELARTKGSDDPIDQAEGASLSVVILATLAFQSAHWIFVNRHGYQPEFLANSSVANSSDTRSIHTIDTYSSVHSFASGSGLLARPPDPVDVGQRAVLLLLGADFELVTYTIGDREVTKRRRQTPIITPPILYGLLGDSPSVLDVSSHDPVRLGQIPAWKDPSDSMHCVSASLSPAGSIAFHGRCGDSTPSTSNEGSPRTGTFTNFEGVAK